jgi:DNA replication protein DnaD
MLADALRDAENSYPIAWIEEALSIAVKKNKRSWSYAAAILKRWQEEGRHEGKGQQDTEEDRRRYVTGKYSEFIEH